MLQTYLKKKELKTLSHVFSCVPKYFEILSRYILKPQPSCPGKASAQVQVWGFCNVPELDGVWLLS